MSEDVLSLKEQRNEFREMTPAKREKSLLKSRAMQGNQNAKKEETKDHFFMGIRVTKEQKLRFEKKADDCFDGNKSLFAIEAFEQWEDDIL